MKSEVELFIVEDNANDAELTLRALARAVAHARVRHLGDGVEVLEALFGEAVAGSSRLPRVILLDLKLPRLDGHEVLRRVRADARTRFIPVVVFTSSSESRDVAESYRLGANSYLVKPLGFEEYRQRVADAARYWIVHNAPPPG